MSWTDKKAIEVIKNIRDYYKTENFIETGTFMGINAEVHAKNFKNVYTIENNGIYYEKAKERLKKYKNVHQKFGDSTELLKETYDLLPIYYLDAHFYNKDGPRWQIKEELKALGRKTCVVIIHDFNNNLGHCVYDGERLGMNVVGGLLKKVNPSFHYYTNNLEGCDIMKPEETDDPIKKDNLKYAWSTPRLTYRGILYCCPTELPDFGLVKLK